MDGAPTEELKFCSLLLLDQPNRHLRVDLRVDQPSSTSTLFEGTTPLELFGTTAVRGDRAEDARAGTTLP